MSCIKSGRRNKISTWNDEAMEEIIIKDALKKMCRNSTKENNRHISIKKKMKKAVLKAMRKRLKKEVNDE